MPYNRAIDEHSRRRIHELHATLMEDVFERSRDRSVATRRGRISYQEFDMKKSKHIVNELDGVFAKAWKLTSEEADYVINYNVDQNWLR